jgi:hypothetical protein
MGGTVRKDRPWIHLLFSERTLMRCHSVYHNEAVLQESYTALEGGLNRMTIAKFRRLLQQNPQIAIQKLEIIPLYWASLLANTPVLNEFIASAVRVRAIKVGSGEAGGGEIKNTRLFTLHSPLFLRIIHPCFTNSLSRLLQDMLRL